MSMVRMKPYKVGDIVKVCHCHGGYPLPEGLPTGAKVRVLAFVHAYRVVAWQEREFKIYMANIDSGLEAVPLLSRPRGNSHGSSSTR